MHGSVAGALSARRFGILVAVVLVLTTPGCNSLGRFEATGSHPFVGEIVGDSEASFIRRGFAPNTELRLTFDPNAANVSGEVGTMTTLDADGHTGELADVPYSTIEALVNDQLSQYDFPGSGRLRNYIFAARPTTGALNSRDVMLFISLMEDDSVEARVVAGPGGAGDYFGIFKLERQ